MAPGAWETLQETPGNVAVQVFNDDPPAGSGVMASPGPRRLSPTLAASAGRLVVAWEAGEGAGIELRQFPR